MSDFLSRSTRFPLQVSMTFQVGSDLVQAVTVNVSESGLLATFLEPVAIWEVGEIAMELGEMLLSVRARVAREENRDYGLSFQIRNDADRRTVQYLVDYASGRV